ncbi:MAG TPA: polysaccharide deacetylase family protein [Aquabacterium sp.]|nr:polysaccharide deacetylase family protein [Aquabacterium sp.]
MSTRCTVLMYHATHRSPTELGGADPHYAVGLDVFERHLDYIEKAGKTARAVERVPDAVQHGEHPVGMTFDDGHVTNLQAAQALAARGWSGTFFVNPGTVGTPHYLSWEQLREMVRMGMSIQSHAQFHRYQDELSYDEQWDDLNRSKAEIEQALDQAVTVFAPPGGRTSGHTRELAQKAGYAWVSTSRVGLWNVDRDSRWDVPRFAVLAGTPLLQLQAWINQAPVEIGKQVWRYRILRGAKNLLGNGGYERLRSAVLGSPKDY